MRILSSVAVAAIMMCAPQAWADEVWGSNLGEVVYQSEIDGFAVFTLAHPDGPRTVFIDGLAGNHSDRVGYFTGYWVMASSDAAGKSVESCPVTILAANGEPYNVWGQVMIEFLSPTFPSGFMGYTGVCLDPPTEDWNADPY